MNVKKEYRQIILPVLQGAPVILLLLVAAVLIVRRTVTYMTPEYRASGAIKINNLDYTQAGFGLFEKQEGSLPKQNENFLTEVEIFKSHDLIEKTLRNLHWELSVYRVGQLRLVELMDENPLLIQYRDVEPGHQDKLFYLDFLGNGIFRISRGESESKLAVELKVGQESRAFGMMLTISPKLDFLKSKPKSLKKGDRFAFRINSMESLVKACGGAKLFVKPVEKDVSIVKIFFNHELPEKAQQFVNTLMQTYIDEGLIVKEQQADATLEYLDRQLNDVSQKLYQAEADLAYFKSSNHIVNTNQETDATLREITQLDLQKVDLDMKASELGRLQNHLWSGNHLSDFSPNFDALQDPIFRENYLKVQNLENQLEDLKQKYAAQHPAISNTEAKIRDLRSFLNESVSATLTNLQLKNREVGRNIDGLNGKIKAYPDKERRLVVMQRDVQLNEATYNYLVRKRTELAIGKTSNLNPHRIIEHAERPQSVASPNKPMLYGLGIFLALLVGLVLSYAWSFLNARVLDKEDVIAAIKAPFLGSVYRSDKAQSVGFDQISGLMVGLKALPKSPVAGQGQLFMVSSLMPGEGKTHTSVQIAKGFAAAGHHTLLIDLDIRKPAAHIAFGLPVGPGFGDVLDDRVFSLRAIRPTAIPNLHLLPAGTLTADNMAQLFSSKSLDVLRDLRWHFDAIVVDTTAVGLFEDNLPLMHHSSANLFILRTGVTKRRTLARINQLLEDFKLPNVHLILNGVAESKAERRLRKTYQQKKRLGMPAGWGMTVRTQA